MCSFEKGGAAITDGFDLETMYQVRVEKFEGPLELLLHLIKKNEVDIYDIPISIITQQYLEYIKLMKELNLELAGEFLVMASTLLQIKSQMLLPPTDPEDPCEEEEDPRAELTRRLLEYQKYKEAANLLENMDQTGRDVFLCSVSEPEVQTVHREEEIIEVELFELIEALQSVLSRIPTEKFHEVTTESISIADRITEILCLLEERNNIRFDDIILERPTREEIIATFLALLELCKRKLIKITQSGLFREIWITPAVMDDGDAVTGVDVAYA